MNKILIVDASDSDRRLMSGLLTRSGYEPIVAEDMEAARQDGASSVRAFFYDSLKKCGGG